MPKARVRPHTRNGRRVRSHSRKLSPGGAGRNAKRAYRAAKRKRHSDAVVWGSVAVAEITAWATMRGTAFALTAIGIALVGIGVAARRSAQ
jgi:hypothetical protein